MARVEKKLVLVSQENETLETVALKLAAYVLFFAQNPILDISLKHPAVSDQEFKPDLLALDDSGAIRLWIECGNVTTHKLNKLIRRYRNARLVVLKGKIHEAGNLRRALQKNDIANSERIEIWSFPDERFGEWLEVFERDSVEIIGEPSEKSFNLVANSILFNFDFVTL